MNILCRELCWTLKRYYPLAVSLILLGIVVKSFKFVLPPILEGGYISIIQIIISGILFVYTFRTLYEIKKNYKTKLKLRELLVFRSLVSITLILEFSSNAIATNVFLLNLFAVAYMDENPFRDFLIMIQDYLIGLLIFPFISWFNFRNIRKTLNLKLENSRCSCIVCLLIKNWIPSSLFIIIVIDLILILS